MTGGEIAFLVGAGVLAGAAGSSGAIGSLISYPALLIAGLNPLAANVTSAAAVAGSGASPTLRSRPELRGPLSPLASRPPGASGRAAVRVVWGGAL